jgi:hypothetical protein
MNADNSWLPELRMIVDDKMYELHLVYDADEEMWEAKAEFRLNLNCTCANLDWLGHGTTIEQAIDDLVQVMRMSPLDMDEEHTDEELDALVRGDRADLS